MKVCDGWLFPLDEIDHQRKESERLTDSSPWSISHEIDCNVTSSLTSNKYWSGWFNQHENVTNSLKSNTIEVVGFSERFGGLNQQWTNQRSKPTNWIKAKIRNSVHYNWLNSYSYFMFENFLNIAGNIDPLQIQKKTQTFLSSCGVPLSYLQGATVASMETSKGQNSIRPFFSSMSRGSYAVQLLESWAKVAKKNAKTNYERKVKNSVVAVICRVKVAKVGRVVTKMCRVKKLSETVL